jgi:LPXTG-motif cell wall-anchored protein
MRDAIGQRVVPYCYRSKALMALLCALGTVGVSYGMLTDNNIAFIVGLLFGIAGYLLIRRKLKQN